MSVYGLIPGQNSCDEVKHATAFYVNYMLFVNPCMSFCSKYANFVDTGRVKKK